MDAEQKEKLLDLLDEAIAEFEERQKAHSPPHIIREKTTELILEGFKEKRSEKGATSCYEARRLIKSQL